MIVSFLGFIARFNVVLRTLCLVSGALVSFPKLRGAIDSQIREWRAFVSFNLMIIVTEHSIVCHCLSSLDDRPEAYRIGVESLEGCFLRVLMGGFASRRVFL